MSAPLRAAIGYAQRGQPVFPCDWVAGEHEKAPMYDRSLGLVNGHLDATCDLQRIVQWWAKWPEALIGGPVPVDEVCLDNDPRKQGDIWDLIELCQLTHLPRCRTVISGRYDGGAHYFFTRHEGDYESARLPRGIDLKDGAKGYTILPPSPHPATDGPYFFRVGTEHLRTPLPVEIHELLVKRPRPKFVYTPNPFGKGKKKWDGMISKVAKEPEGNRQSIGFYAANRLLEEGAPIEAWDDLERAMIANGATKHDIERALRDIPDGRFSRA
jgi:hypothetical protein